MKKRILCLVLALVLCLSLVACGVKAPAGTYVDESGTITFTFEDNKVSASAYDTKVADGTFTVKGKQVELTFTGEFADYLNAMSGLTYNAKDDTLTDGAGATLYKK